MVSPLNVDYIVDTALARWRAGRSAEQMRGVDGITVTVAPVQVRIAPQPQGANLPVVVIATVLAVGGREIESRSVTLIDP
jgi:hypothetical protein